MNDSHGHAAPAHGDRPRYDDVNVSVIVMVGIVSAIITYFIVVFVQGITYQMTNDYVRRRSYDIPYIKSVEAIEHQQVNLTANAPGRIAIEDAMRQTVEDFATPPKQ